jgi:hypothetical protein
MISAKTLSAWYWAVTITSESLTIVGISLFLVASAMGTVIY